MSNILKTAYRESIERDLRLIEMLAQDVRDGLDHKKSIPVRKYAQSISTIATSMYCALDMYEELRDADVSE